ATDAAAEAPTTEAPKTEAPKSETKKPAAKKAEPKKAEPKKAEPKKPVAAQTEEAPVATEEPTPAVEADTDKKDA
ncbi:MAG: 30S ribosomal protein S2, partial [Aquiluna sp.]